MLLEREIGRIHAERLAETRHRGRRTPSPGLRAALAERLHRLANRIEPAQAPARPAYPC
ncbi:MAG: hypothetical protein R3343_12590 [Nitriliruptorales bacterium]|nr:hypothetical protein [Nitriliruptorales bacterium]